MRASGASLSGGYRVIIESRIELPFGTADGRPRRTLQTPKDIVELCSSNGSDMREGWKNALSAS